MTQQMLVARLNLGGWSISRETLAKIETQIRWVADFEVVCLAKALKVPVTALLPDEEASRRAAKGLAESLHG